jgi:hypothetical protein
MMKIVAVAALFAAAFTAPTISVQAATMADVANSCWVFPLLKQECWDEAKANWDAAHDTAVEATHAAVEMNWPTPPWWNCEPAPAGSGHLLDCSK